MTTAAGALARPLGRGSVRIATLVLAAVVALAVLPAAGGAVILGAERSHARVAIIVGPVGSMTDFYRGLANEAAAVARRLSDDVVMVSSPNATWPRVRRALQGASVVVYLGHGNGWPSPYRDSLYPPTQNGLGLNPVAGGGDEAHQYFGESYLSKSVRLAPGAVVVLSHLCYASGNPEPGGPEPTLSVALQRADNYAAGWLGAGAAAVVAEAHSGPAYYVDAVLRSDASLERIWRSAPTFHDHLVRIDSNRTPGHQVMLDPDHARNGYNRSLVSRPGARSADVQTASGHRQSALPAMPDGSAATVISRSAVFGAPDLARPPIAADRSFVSLPLKRGTLNLLPDELLVGVRWDLIQASGPAPATAAPPDPELVSGSPPAIDLVAPETPGAVVTTGPTVVKSTRLGVEVRLPDRPGLYRLVTTLHDRDGVAFDAATQARIPALLVQVTGPVWATYSTIDSVAVRPSAALPMSIRVANSGSQPWSEPAAPTAVTTNPTATPADPSASPADPSVPPSAAPADPSEAAADPSQAAADPSVTPAGPGADPPVLVARWLALDGPLGSAPAASDTSTPVDASPGSDRLVHLTMTAPAQPGHYLVVIDVLAPGRGSLAALGVPSGLVHVTVDPAAATIPVLWDAPTRLRFRRG